MTLSTFEQTIIFIFVFIVFLPFTSKVVRLANTTWDNREYLEQDRVRQVVIFTPILLILALMLVYFGVIFLIDVLIF